MISIIMANVCRTPQKLLSVVLPAGFEAMGKSRVFSDDRWQQCSLTLNTSTQPEAPEGQVMTKYAE
jgi:hypothetical protein